MWLRLGLLIIKEFPLGGSNQNGSHRFIYLNTWSPSARPIWEGPQGVSCHRKCATGCEFYAFKRFMNQFPVLFLWLAVEQDVNFLLLLWQTIMDFNPLKPWAKLEVALFMVIYHSNGKVTKIGGKGRPQLSDLWRTVFLSPASCLNISKPISQSGSVYPYCVLGTKTYYPSGGLGLGA